MTRNSKKYRQDKKILLTVAALILCAVVCRLFSRFDVVDDALNYLCSLLRSIIYMGIIITWGVSVRRRVLNRSVRRYLMAIAALLLFWFGIRTCKFLFLEGIPALQYYCWYGYYIPMILIPLMGIYLACCLGRPENYTLPTQLKVITVPAILFILLILTNNFHQKVFAFPFGMEDAECIYVHKPLYFVCLGWMFAEVIAFFGPAFGAKPCAEQKADLGTSDTGGGSFFILYRISYGEQDPFHDRRRYDSCYDFDHAVGL